MSRGRPLVWTGLAVAGVGGYYLYSSGGDPKVAQKQAQHDAAAASANIKSHIPGTGKEAKTQAELSASKVGSAVDDAVARAKDTTHKVDQKLEAYRQSADKKIDAYTKDTKQNFNKAVDTFDKTVEKKASETKSWFGGVFGGK